MKYLSASILLAISFISVPAAETFGQKDKERLTDLGLHTPWQKGKITLIDGEVLSGNVRYNDNQQIVSFRTAIDDEELMRSFRPKDVASMILIDSVTQKKRLFLSLRFNPRDKDEFEWEVDHKNIVSFFEVHYEGEKFAVVSHINPLSTNQRTYDPNAGTPSARGKYLVSQQVRYVFFVDDQGIFDRYISISKHSVNKDPTTTKAHLREFEILEKYLGEDWPELKAHAKEKKEKLKSIESLEWLLAQYTILNAR